MSNPSFLYYDPRSLPLNSNGVPMPGATLNFYYTGTTTPAPVYADAGLTQQYPPTNLEADSMGRFPAIYLDSTIAYRSQLYDQNGILYEDIDPINSIQTNVNYSVSKVLTTGRVSTTTLTNDPELVIALTSGSYSLNGFISYIANGNPGGGINFNVTNSVSLGNGSGCVFNGSSGSGNQTLVNTQGAVTWDTSTNHGTVYVVSIAGFLVVPQPLTIAFAWSQNTSSTNATIVYPGSFLYLTKISSYTGLVV